MREGPDATLIEKIALSVIAIFLLAYAALGIVLDEIPTLPSRDTSGSGLFY